VGVGGGAIPSPAVPHVLLATDADHLADDIFAALVDDETTVSRVRKGVEVRPAVAALEPDLVILDLQIGNMGGVAASIDLRHESDSGRLPRVQILMLLDRDADRWIAQEARADAEILKPITSFGLRRAVAAVLAGDTSAEADDTVTVG